MTDTSVIAPVVAEPPVAPVAQEQVAVKTPIADIPNKTLDRLFSGLPAEEFGKPDQSAIVKKEEPAPEKKPVKEAPKKVEPKEDEESEEAPEETDFDKPIEEAAPEPSEEDDEPADETMARKMAKENGRRAKKAEALVKDIELERDREREARTKAEEELKGLKVTKIRPQDDPDYVRLRDEVIDSVETQADLLPEAKDIPRHFGTFVGAYLDSKGLPADQRRAARDQLKQDIIAKCGRFDVAYDEMSPEEQREADRLAAGVMQIVTNNAGKSEEVITLGNKLEGDAEFGSAALKEREYKSSIDRIQPDLDVLGDLDDATIAEHPHAIEAIIAAAVKDSPAAQKRSQDAKDLIRDVIAGPRALTQREREKLKANGTNMKDFEAARQEKHAAKVKKLMTYAYRGLMSPLYSARLAEWGKLKSDADAEASEEDTIRQVVKRAPSKQRETVVRPSERKNYGLSRFE